MRPSEIENWTLKVLEQLKAGERIEETRVEVKTIWINPQEAARKIAGHANAARGESILWIFGIDERNSNVVGVKKEELAVWWERVMSEFDGSTPTMIDINVFIDGVTVVSLLFETDRAPFVVKNPNYNKQKDKIKFEVPWREGTSTRTAHRTDLLRLLVPIVHKPEIEILGGELTCSEDKAAGTLSWNLVALKLYVEPAQHEEINFVFHRCEVAFEIPDIIERTVLSNIRIAPPYVQDFSGSHALGTPYGGPMKPDSVTAAHTQSEMIFQGPGRGDLKGGIETVYLKPQFDDSEVNLFAKLAYSHGEQQVLIQQKLTWNKPNPKEDWILGRWSS